MTEDLLCLKRVLVGEGLKVATAESCTGGALAHALTSIPGSSEYFLGGIVAYSTDVKTEILGVRKETVERYGVYSEEVVREMAEGACRLTGADLCLATSGEFNGRGFFYYCLLWRGVYLCGKEYVSGDRVEMKERAVAFLLRRVLKVVLSDVRP